MPTVVIVAALIVSVPPPFKANELIFTLPFKLVPVELVTLNEKLPLVAPMVVVDVPLLIVLFPVKTVVPKTIGLLLVLSCVFNVVVLAVLVKPLLNVALVPAIVTPLVLLNVTALANVSDDPFITTAYGCA